MFYQSNMFCQNDLLLDFGVVFQWRPVFGYLSWRTRSIRKTKLNTEFFCLILQCRGHYFISKHNTQLLHNCKWRRLHMVTSVWIVSKHIFITIPPWQLHSMDSSKNPCSFLLSLAYHIQNTGRYLWMWTKLTMCNT